MKRFGSNLASGLILLFLVAPYFAICGVLIVLFPFFNWTTIFNKLQKRASDL